MTITTNRVDAALQGILDLAAELELELAGLDKRRAEVLRELNRLRAGSRRAFANAPPDPSDLGS